MPIFPISKKQRCTPVSETNRAFTTGLVEVPVNVQAPPAIVAKEKGTGNLERFSFLFKDQCRNAGVRIMTIGVWFKKAEKRLIGKSIMDSRAI